ncbi:MAG: CHASE2 domain-containing protein [Longimicrobiales bacterium]|nr:CHASE2 domain-containing protein [Longimicrobiales bacterium]
MKKARRLAALGLVVVGSMGLSLLLGDALGDLTGVRSFEDFTLDLRQRTTPVSFQEGIGERPSEIVLVLFDELTFQETAWLSPFSRSHLAEVVDAVSAAGARTIGIDVYVDRLYPQLNEIDRGDELLRDAIDRAGNVILVSPIQQTDSGPVVLPPHPYFTEGRLVLGALLPFAVVFVRGLALLCARLPARAAGWLLLAWLVLVTATDVALAAEAFRSPWSWLRAG